MKTLAHPLPPFVSRNKAKARKPLRVKNGVDPVELSKTVGKGLTLWVLFTSSLNWLYYRNKTKQ